MEEELALDETGLVEETAALEVLIAEEESGLEELIEVGFAQEIKTKAKDERSNNDRFSMLIEPRKYRSPCSKRNHRGPAQYPLWR